ncbi:hypothetical protein KC19_7G123600 [Ceratodon purpureus]|uniref:Uncharacterized protein n=1 Tax=Ceratodon purpureus TaxID=3225 RepID=A0A8T0H7C0_CERPU|nr:hypothetical protein KC19_7G123600 [Ceratodon purpureus]
MTKYVKFGSEGKHLPRPQIKMEPVHMDAFKKSFPDLGRGVLLQLFSFCCKTLITNLLQMRPPRSSQQFHQRMLVHDAWAPPMLRTSALIESPSVFCKWNCPGLLL